MFDDQPSYLGGLTTQLQDSMNGIQYGRSDVNENGQYVPNDAASGTVYTKMPTKEDVSRRSPPSRPLSGNSIEEVYATIEEHVQNLKRNSRPVDFFGLTMPSGLVDSTPKLEDWIASAEALEAALHKNLSLLKQVQRPELSVARLALEFIQPDTVRMNTISQIERVQQLLVHLREQARVNNIEVKPSNNAPTFSMILEDIANQASKGANRPRTKIGEFSVPQDFIRAFPNLNPQTIRSNLNSIIQQIQAGEEIIVDPKILGTTIPILFYTTGKYTTDPQEVLKMASNFVITNRSYTHTSYVPQNNAANPNVPQNNSANQNNIANQNNSANQTQESNFFSSTGGKIAMVAVGATVLYSLFNRN